jgi:hypothetical protein
LDRFGFSVQDDKTSDGGAIVVAGGKVLLCVRWQPTSQLITGESVIKGNGDGRAHAVDAIPVSSRLTIRGRGRRASHQASSKASSNQAA